jgi:hypothetical protein
MMNYSRWWPLGIAIIYIAFVLILVALIIFSRFQRVDLVTEDYYDREIKYQQQINRIDRAQSLSEPVHWIHDNKKRVVIVNFPPDFNPDQIQGNILFFRPSDAKQDRVVAVNLSADGTQQISTQNLTPGLWKLKVFWHVNKIEYYEEGILIVQ